MATKTPVEVVQEAYAAFGRGDVPAILELLDDKAEWKFVGAKGRPYARSARGKEDVASWFGSVAATEEIQAFEPREFIAGGDRVTVLGFERTVARATGKTYEAEWVHVFTVRDGRVVRFWGMYDTAAAAAAYA